MSDQHGDLIVAADRDRCCGSGNCAAVLPEVFAQDATGLAVIRAARLPARHHRAAREAVLLCPARAITLREATPERAERGFPATDD